MAHLNRNNDNDLDRRDETDAPSIDAMMREVLHMLGNVDFQYEVELDRAEMHASSGEVKEHIRRKIRAAHRERRQPYVEFLATLRQRRHRLACPM